MFIEKRYQIIGGGGTGGELVKIGVILLKGIRVIFKTSVVVSFRVMVVSLFDFVLVSLANSPRTNTFSGCFSEKGFI